MADRIKRQYGESAVAYEDVLRGEPWPDGFWSSTIITVLRTSATSLFVLCTALKKTAS